MEIFDGPWIPILLFAAGFLAGWIDAIAGGGGLISVPALLAAGLSPQMALGTNKMQSVWGTLIATIRYRNAGLIDLRSMRVAIVGTFVAALAGTFAVTQVSNDLLRALVPWLLLGIAIYAMLSPRFGGGRGKARLSSTAFGLLAGALLGFYDGFFGPGTGSFWTLGCLSLLGLELKKATAYTKVVNLTSNVASLIVFISAGKVVVAVAAVMVAGQLLGARIGAGLVIRHGAPFIRVVFLTVVLLLVAKLMWDQFS